MSGAVRIRPYTAEDAEAVWEAVGESMAELAPWMPWCRPGYSPADSREWLEAQVKAFQAGTAFEFAIVGPDGRYLGGCGLNQIDRVNRRANLGYWVRTGAAGRGVATAAVELLRAWAFACTDLVRLEVVVATGNGPSHRVAEKAGAIREAVLRHRLLLDGAPRDATLYAFVRTPAAAPRPACRQSIASVALLVRDYGEAIAFYVRSLGFALLEDTDLGEGKRWVVVAPPGPPGTTLLLARAATPEQVARVGDQTGGRVFLFLHTDDFWRDYRDMSARGVRFTGSPRQEAYGIVAVFEDLYGNRWDLLEPNTGNRPRGRERV
jgi:RimJ/RimL family protein N-acetyltransferase/catechol 2,3-dioxygenase-like lactoylglutathione lyase family enzyme